MNTARELWDAWVQSAWTLSVGAYLQAFSLPISMLVAWLTFRATTSNLRYTMVVSEVNEHLKELSKAARDLAADIEEHYMGKYEGGFTANAARESRNSIMSAIKALNDKREVIGVFLRRDRNRELQERFDRWQTMALGDNFPVTRKDDRCKEFEEPVANVRKAQSEFERYLATLRKSCMDERWHLRRAMQ